MKQVSIFTVRVGVVAALVGATGLCMAQTGNSQVAPGPEYGRVLSSTAVQTAVNVPRQVCGTEQVVAPTQKSGAGALVGAIAGGAMGNAVGQGSGRALATAVGIVGGAMMGDHIEGPTASQVHNVQRCVTQQTTEYRTTGYNVVYEYAGRQYSVQMPNDPGQWIKVQVSPVGSQSAVPISMTQPVVAQQYTMVLADSVVYAPPTVVYASPMVLSPSVVVGASYVRGHRYHHAYPSLGVGMTYGAPGHSRHWY